MLGSVVEGVEVDDVAATGKTFPDFPGVWAALLDAPMSGATTSTTTSTTSARAAVPGRAPRSDRPTTTPSTASSPRSTGAGSRCSVDGVAVWAVKARPLGRKGVVVGDRVRVVGDVSGEDGALARIVEVQERTTVLRRTADDDDPVERVVVANADQLVVVTALADPEPRPRLIDRALVAAFVSGMKPLLCLTKADLADPETLLVDLPLPRGAVGGHPARRRPDRAPGAAARPHQRADRPQRRRQVHAGQRADPRRPPRRRGRQRRHRPRAAHLDVGADAGAAPRRRSTGGWIIDTPGIRSFGLAHVRPEDLIEAFPDLDEMTEDCPRGCTHGADEPECGLDEAVARGEADPERVESFRRLLEARSEPAY